VPLAAGAREQLEIGALCVVAALAAAQVAEGLLPRRDGPLLPLVYLALAFLAASYRRLVSVALAVLVVGLDLAGWRARGAPPTELPLVVVHAALTVLFAGVVRAVLAVRLSAAGRAERAAVSRRLREIDDRARALRLLGPEPGESPEARRQGAAGAAVVEVEAAVRGVLEVAEVALRAHTAALFLVSDDARELRLHDCRSASERVTGRADAGAGPLGAALRGVRPVRVEGAFAASWYEDGTRPAAALAAPLVDRGGHVRGVLVVDRLDPAPFGERDERLIATLAAEILRVVESERLVGDLRRARDEGERFYQAIERLNRTAKAREAFDALLEVAATIVPVDFGAVTLADDTPAGVRHRVERVAAASEQGRALEGLEFDDGPGLVGSSVRLGASLPARELDPARATVFDETTRLRGLAALKVIPLKTGDRVLGTVVLGSRRRGVYGGDAVRQLEVVAMQAADAILRARLFDETERLATTDGLTGLLNHRTFQARLDEQLAQAIRYGRPLAVVLADVDHFKKVNDTHGHPAGDEVLRGVARLLAKQARAADVVARYGGEEFALLLPETDAQGALTVAERIREQAAAAAFATPRGLLAVTLSLGIAAFPASGSTKGALLEASDGALYASKRAGRNRVTVAGPTRG
jgi:two-component system cell cycle response regulator